MDNMAGGYQLSHFWNRTECSGPWYHLSVTLRPRGGMIGIPLFSFFWTRGERLICFWTDTQLHEHGD